jgi:hypothetical protein
MYLITSSDSFKEFSLMTPKFTAPHKTYVENDETSGGVPVDFHLPNSENPGQVSSMPG